MAYKKNSVGWGISKQSNTELVGIILWTHKDNGRHDLDPQREGGYDWDLLNVLGFSGAPFHATPKRGKNNKETAE